MAIAAGIIIGIVILGIVVTIMMRGRRRLNASQSKRITQLWAHMEANQNPTLKVIEADKILYEALNMLGYPGSLGEKLKKAGPRFSDLNGVWAAHKLRNRVAHELNVKPGEGEVKVALGALERGLRDLGMT